MLFGDSLVSEPDLEVPHPRFRERFFVLGPLAEIAPDMRDPLTGLKVWELLRSVAEGREPVVGQVFGSQSETKRAGDISRPSLSFELPYCPYYCFL